MKSTITLFSLFAVTLAALLLGGCGPSDSGANAAPPTLRVNAIPSGFQGLVAELIAHYGFDEANGFKLEIVESAGQRGANFISMKTGQADLLTSNWIDAAINRRGGLGVKVIIPFMKWSNGWVVPSDSDIHGLGDFRGKRIGITNPGQLDWIITRLIAQKEFGFDPAEDATVTVAAPGLLSGFLAQGELDVILQYTEPALQMAKTDEYDQLFSVNEIMAEYGLAPAAPFTCFLQSEASMAAHPELGAAYFAAYQAAMDTLENDPAALDIVMEAFDIQDRASAAEIRDLVLANVYREIDPALTTACETLFRAFLETLGPDNLGVGELPEGTFAWVTEVVPPE